MIMSGLIPIFASAPIADPMPPGAAIVAPFGAAIVMPAGNVGDDDAANPGVNGVAAGSALLGAAASNASMPGTAFATCAKSSGARRDLAIPKRAPAAAAACSGVAWSSFASPFTSSGLLLTAVVTASVCGC